MGPLSLIYNIWGHRFLTIWEGKKKRLKFGAI